MKLPTIVAILLVLATTIPSPAQKITPAAPERFPYMLDNFPWWTDADLRGQLKRAIPKLGEDLPRGSALESEIQNRLVALLKAKGITARVIVKEPDADVARQHFVDNSPGPLIHFQIVSPDIVVDSLVFHGIPEDTDPSLSGFASAQKDQQYSIAREWADRANILQMLEPSGYLSAKVSFQPGTPRLESGWYRVPVTATLVPGPKYRIAGISAYGGPLLEGRDLSPFFEAKVGDVVHGNPFRRLEGTIRIAYQKAGYADVETHDEPVLDPAAGTATYTLRVVPGHIYHLRSLTILHLDGAQQSLVQSILKISPGDIFDGEATTQLYRSLSDPSSPLHGYRFTFGPKKDNINGTVDLTLDFYKGQ